LICLNQFSFILKNVSYNNDIRYNVNINSIEFRKFEAINKAYNENSYNSVVNNVLKYNKLANATMITYYDHDNMDNLLTKMNLKKICLIEKQFLSGTTTECFHTNNYRSYISTVMNHNCVLYNALDDFSSSNQANNSIYFEDFVEEVENNNNNSSNYKNNLNKHRRSRILNSFFRQSF
jgi:hypothetical protein